MTAKITAPAIRARKGGDKITMITAYDEPTARIADRAGADIILVGDSVANVVLGRTDTLGMTIDEMVHHTAAVTSAEPNALIVGDMPWLSYHTTTEAAVRNAGRFVQEGGAESVKLEGGEKRLDVIRAVLDAEIPVMGHLGLTPQSVQAMGGYHVQGRQAAAAYNLVTEAKMLAEAGVFAIVLEGVPDVVAELVTREVAVPTIGIGAGAACDGQVLVFHDVLGLHKKRTAKFVRQYAQLADVAEAALQEFFADVRSGDFPGEDETYHMPEESAQILEELHEGSADLPGAGLVTDTFLADEAMES
ncbi:MAG: 3-methyl-2-oxobutanoate hydroxymethyltransferase [Acidimicrobiia bacterium]|nr:3-methyl-2-oxobutanoate hydroxymethyltransferase [Acidimicrobiia bacterium]